MKKRLLFSLSLLSAICLTTCTRKVSLEWSAEEFETFILPPGGVEIAPGLFYDRQEITVRDWWEYLHWIRDVYGIKSDEFKGSAISMFRAFGEGVFYIRSICRFPNSWGEPHPGCSLRKMACGPNP